MIVESNYCLGSNKVKANTAFEWFITLPGIKIAELSILTNDGLEIPSLQDGNWPTSVYKIEGIDIKVPDIFVL